MGFVAGDQGVDGFRTNPGQAHGLSGGEGARIVRPPNPPTSFSTPVSTALVSDVVADERAGRPKKKATILGKAPLANKLVPTLDAFGNKTLLGN